MKLPPLQKYRVVLAAAVLMIALTVGWWANQQPAPTAVPQAGSEAPAVAAAVAPPAAAAKAAGAAETAPAAAEQITDIFAVRTWEPPPPPVDATPPPPQAPPLPFRFLGRIAEPGKPVVFLLLVEGEPVFQVKVGDTITNTYRVEKFDGGQLFFRYRPMNIIQTLAVGNVP